MVRLSSRAFGVLAIGLSLLPASRLAAAPQGSPVMETAQLAPSVSSGVGDFGVTVTGSGDTVVVGAPFEDVGGIVDQGLVYVFEESPSGWVNTTEVAVLTASDGGANHRFGDALAIDGDTIIVGAQGADPGGSTRQGAAYVFVKPASGWVNATETAKLIPTDGALNDLFGNAVSIRGDTVVVGAWGADLGGLNHGAVYVFERPGSAWVNTNEVAKLTASDAEEHDWFGSGVAIDGDAIAVGEPTASPPTSPFSIGPGSVYVFERPASGWVSATETAKLTASDGANGAALGGTVSLSGDTVVAGALGALPNGAAYVFVKSQAAWQDGTETAKLTASDGAADDGFADCVFIDGGTVLIGAPSKDLLCSDQGAAYLFEEPSTGWASGVETARLVASDGAVGDSFGESVSARAGTFVVGSDRGFNPGSAVYVFDQPYSSGPLLSLATISPSLVTNCGSNTIVLTGTGLWCVNTLTVGGVSIPGISQTKTRTTLTFSLPDGHPAGSHAVVVSTSAMGPSNSLTLTVQDPAAPVLSTITPPVVANANTPRQIVLTGTGFDCVASVSVDGEAVPFSMPTSTSIAFTTPDGIAVGDHSVVVANANASNELTLAVVASHPSVLVAPGVHQTGTVIPYVTWTDAGWFAQYFLSAVAGPTALPGVISFEIGGGALGNIVPVFAAQADAAGFVELSIYMPAGFPTPFSLHWECMTWDPTVPLGLQTPLETSNPEFVTTFL